MRQVLTWMGLIIFFVFVIIASITIPRGLEGTEKNRGDGRITQFRQENVEVYTLNAEISSKTRNNILIKGTTNLPEGSVLEIEASRGVMFWGDTKPRFGGEGRGIINAITSNGMFETEIKLDDEDFENWLKVAGDEVKEVSSEVKVSIMFDPTSDYQSKDVIGVVGINGEKLVNSPLRDIFGEKTDNPVNKLLFEKTILLPYKN